MHRLSRWLVLVEQIASEKNHIHLSDHHVSTPFCLLACSCRFLLFYLRLHSLLQDLLECVEGVVATYRVLFQIAEMIICRDKDLERVLF